MGVFSVLSKATTWWNSQTLGTQLYTWRKGVKVGEDDAGNVFFKDKHDNRRWVIYNGEVDASKIPVEWYSWMHFTPNKIEKTHELEKYDWQKPHQSNLTGTEEAYFPNKNKDGVKKKYTSWKE